MGVGVMEFFRFRVWFVIDLFLCEYGFGVIHGFTLENLLLRSRSLSSRKNVKNSSSTDLYILNPVIRRPDFTIRALLTQTLFAEPDHSIESMQGSCIWGC